jgi:uncharacterized membrane protein
MRPETRIAAPIFAAIPVALLSAAVATTWAIAHGAPAWLRLAFRFFCHGIPSRCLTLWSVPMPLCARCVAIYAGLFLGLVSWFVLPYLEERVMRMVMFAATTPLAIDGITQALRLRESTNPLRLATGLAAGLTFGLWVLSALERREGQEFTTS